MDGESGGEDYGDVDGESGGEGDGDVEGKYAVVFMVHCRYRVTTKHSSRNGDGGGDGGGVETERWWGG